MTMMLAFPSLLSIIVFLQCAQAKPMTIPVKRSELINRRSSTGPDGQLGCIQMESSPGEYWYSSEGAAGVCGLYLIGGVDRLVELEFSEFSIGCEDGGLLALVDGWELNGDLFPSFEDHPQSFDERYKTFCGEDRPARVFLATQNVALIQFFIPHTGQGFKVNVRFLPNPQPCNVMSMVKSGTVTLKNYGQRRNCSLSIIYPENVLLLNVDVGVTYEGVTMEMETGLTVKCSNSAGGDYVELLYGSGLDTEMMTRRMAFCGIRSKAARKAVTLGCQHSAVRLVSSGAYYNDVTVSYASPSARDLEHFDTARC